MRITNFFESAFKTVRGYQCSSASESISVMLICIMLINIEEVDHEHRLQPVRRDSQEKYNPVNLGRKPGKKKHESFSSKIISQYFNTGWKQIIQKEVEQEKA